MELGGLDTALSELEVIVETKGLANRRPNLDVAIEGSVPSIHGHRAGAGLRDRQPVRGDGYVVPRGVGAAAIDGGVAAVAADPHPVSLTQRVGAGGLCCRGGLVFPAALLPVKRAGTARGILGGGQTGCK